MTESTPKNRHLSLLLRLSGWTRFVAFIPALSLFIGGLALAVKTAVEATEEVHAAFAGELSAKELGARAVEHADLFLLAVALFILGLGLFSLFLTDRVPLPSWLQIRTFDDLKELLVNVVVVLVGVHFAGELLEGSGGINLLWQGLGSAAVILALTFFVERIFKRGH